MIVRILTDNQYRLGDEHQSAVAQLDNEMLSAMDAGDAQGFSAALQRLVELVQQQATVVAIDEVVPSNVIVPAPDMSLEEARALMQKAEAQVPKGE